MVAHRQERGCGRQHRECSCVDRISGRTNGRRKRTKSGPSTSVVPVSYSCRTKIVQAVLDRQRSGVKATIWWFCHDHDRSGRSAMIGNIGKEWSAQCDLGFTALTNNMDELLIHAIISRKMYHVVDSSHGWCLQVYSIIAIISETKKVIISILIALYKAVVIPVL